MTAVLFNTEEKFIAEVRRHWFVFALESAGALSAALIPAGLLYFLLSLSGQAMTSRLFYLGLFFYLLWLLFVWLYFFLAWTDYYLDVWIITDRKIIDIDQKGLFHREISSFRLDHIQDVTIETTGFIETLLKFGRLHIHTAGDGHDFVLEAAANPEVAKQIILDLAHNSHRLEERH